MEEVTWNDRAVGSDHCSLATRCNLIPHPNHCPRAASLECEEGGITPVKCFVLPRSGSVTKLETSICVVGLDVLVSFVETTCSPRIFSHPRMSKGGAAGHWELVPGRISSTLRRRWIHTFLNVLVFGLFCYCQFRVNRRSVRAGVFIQCCTSSS